MAADVCALEDTHSSLQTRLEGTFQLLRQCLDCCYCPFCLPPALPLHPSLSPIVSSKRLCRLLGGGGLIVVVFLVSFLLHPCSFAERRPYAMSPIDPLNRPRNSSLHQAPLCWPGQHSTYKVDGLPCHTPHYCKWDGGSVAVTPPPFSIPLHRTYLNIL